MWGNNAMYPLRHAKADHARASVKLIIGGSGAVSSVAGAPGVSAARSGTGGYDITFPKCPGVHLAGWSLKSAAGTVKTLWYVSYSASSGTAQITTGNGGGTAADPASGDEIHLDFDVQLSGVD